jgi:hypothetical protein
VGRAWQSSFHPTINDSINRGHSHTPLPHNLYTSISRCAILPLRYRSLTKARKKLGNMSAKGEKNCRFFHLLRFLGRETNAKRAKRPTLSSVGEQGLAQDEQRLRREEDFTAVTIGNSLSGLRHLAAWCECTWKQGREEDLPFTPFKVTPPTITDYRTSLQLILPLKPKETTISSRRE